MALPLLALVLTGSPFQAGLVGFARALSYPLAAIPSGVLADRFDRRRLLLISTGGRVLAMVTVILTLILARPPLAQLLLVAFADSALWTLGMAVERGAIRRLVPTSELQRALALEEGRTAAAAIAGPPLGGALFALGRSLPFVFDAVSSVAAWAAAVRIRTPLQESTGRRGGAPGLRSAAVHAVEGLGFLWRRPFLRDSSLLYGALNVSNNALELLVLLIAHQYGASSAAIGGMFAIMGAGGLAGAALAERAGGRIPAALAIALEPWTFLLLTPLLLVVHRAVLLGVIGALMFVAMPLSSATVISRRIVMTPDRLQGRVQAGASLLASSVAWAGPLVTGAVFASSGATAATVTVLVWELWIVLAVSASASLRRPPPLGETPL